jgi:hypothetical protein
VPLHDPAGSVIGALCMLDSRPHDDAYVPLHEFRLVAVEAEVRLAERLRQRESEGLTQPA